LFANAEINGDLGHPAAPFNQIQNAPSKLRRVTPPCHIALLHDYGSRIQLFASVQLGAGQFDSTFRRCESNVYWPAWNPPAIARAPARPRRPCQVV
jgi:hypothetical protein